MAVNNLILDGGSQISGEITISGSKNAALPIIASTLLTDEKVVISNVPKVSDVYYMIELIEHYGKQCTFFNNVLTIEKTDAKKTLNHLIFGKIRASCLVMGPLLAKYGKCALRMPGGCAIGERPIDMHISSLKLMGAEIKIEKDIIKSEVSNKLVGKKITFSKASVGATENIIMAATLAQGVTIIENPAIEPEVVDLANFLVKIGAKIEGIGTHTLIIQGVNQLSGCNYSIIPDRLECATYLMLTAAVGGQVIIKNTCKSHLLPLLEILHATKSIEIKFQSEKKILVKKIDDIYPVNISTGVYPQFPTDLQPQFAALMCLAKGKSIIKENIFERRFNYVKELQKLTCNIKQIDSRTIEVNGKNKIFGSFLNATDLRAGAALIIAASSSCGKSTITNAYHIHRGYEDIINKLTNCNLKITTESSTVIKDNKYKQEIRILQQADLSL